MDTTHSDFPVPVESSGKKGASGIRAGLKNKLIWTMLGVGALPLMLAMILSYLQGTKSLQGVIGASFKALAYETSTKIDLLIEGEISKNIRHAAHPVIKSVIQDFNQTLLALDPVTRQKNIQEQSRNPIQPDPFLRQIRYCKVSRKERLHLPLQHEPCISPMSSGFSGQASMTFLNFSIRENRNGKKLSMAAKILFI